MQHKMIVVAAHKVDERETIITGIVTADWAKFVIIELPLEFFTVQLNSVFVCELYCNE